MEYLVEPLEAGSELDALPLGNGLCGGGCYGDNGICGKNCNS